MVVVPGLKEIKPINFIFHRSEISVGEMSGLVSVARELWKEAVRTDLQITGPIQWHYFGFNGDARVKFILEVSLPVSEIISGYDGKFHFKRTENYKCASLIHEGGWNGIVQSYERLMNYIRRKRLRTNS